MFPRAKSAEFLLKAVLIKEVGARPMTHSLYEMAKRLSALKNAELGEEGLSAPRRWSNTTYSPDIPTLGSASTSVGRLRRV